MSTREEEIKKHFLELKLDSEHIPVYTVRNGLLNAVKSNLQVFHGVLLDVGCGQMPYREIILGENKKIEKYIGLDLENSEIHNTAVADLFWDAKTIPLSDATIDSAMATEVLEHSFEPDHTLGEIARVLKPGGTFFCTIPFIWPLHEVPYDAYRYTPFSLKKHLEKAGFTDIEIGSQGGWDASLAQMIGLWVSEARLNPRQKKWATKLAVKLIPRLLKRDIKDNSFGHHCMYTGLFATARKK